MPVISLGHGIPGPVGRFEVLENDPRLLIPIPGIAPNVEVAPPTTGLGISSPLEPGMLVRGVVDYKLGDYAQTPAMGLAEENLEVTESSIRRVDVGIVGDIIPIVAQRGRAEGKKPDGRYAEILKVVQFPNEPSEVSDAIPVAIGERADVEFVNDRVFIPERIIIKLKVFSPAISHRSHPLHEVIEILLRANPTPQAEDVCGNNPRIKLYVIPWAVPQVPRVAQKVMDLKRLLRVYSQRFKGKFQPAGMFVVSVQIHHNHDDVG
jgi:hypothetical protein